MKDRSAIIARSQLCRSIVGEVARPHRVSSSAAPTARARPSGDLSGLPRRSYFWLVRSVTVHCR
eukprot:1072936-Prymnesium_polylepis.1